MSVVPYNQNNQVVFHDSNLGIVVVHDNQKNTIQLVSTLDKSRRSSHGGINEGNNLTECPNCGFLWNTNTSNRRYLRLRLRSSDFVGNVNINDNNDINNNNTNNNSNNHNGKIGNEVQSGQFPYFSGSFDDGPLDENFMHHDYFKLLGGLPSIRQPLLVGPIQNLKIFSNNTSSNTNESSSSSTLPESIFNQGYFKRFFKKVPPYTLGSGAHAQVYKVVHVLNDIKLGTYAVKRICMGDKIELLPHVLNEVMILYELSTKGANENNLIRYNHVWLELGELDDLLTFILPPDNVNQSPKVPYVFILQQYCAGGHLEDIIYDNFLKDERLTMKERIERERKQRRKRRKSISLEVYEKEEEEEKETNSRNWFLDAEIWKFFKDVANGVQYLHCHGILHRDLKPSNCLLDTKYTPVGENWGIDLIIKRLPKVLVTDFGEGKYLNKHKKFEVLEEVEDTSINLFDQEEEVRRGNTGTLEFTAPELWLYSNYDPEIADSPSGSSLMNEFTYESDVYSLGLILCWLCVGTLPFTDQIADQTDPQVIRSKILDWYFQVTPESFGRWFEGKLKTRLSGTMKHFQKLVYLMIKGNEREGVSLSSSSLSNRILMDEVLAYLENMKAELSYHEESQPMSRKMKATIKFKELVRRKYNIIILIGYIICYLVIELGIYSGPRSDLNSFFLLKLVLFVFAGFDLTVRSKRNAARVSSCAGMLSVCIGVFLSKLKT